MEDLCCERRKKEKEKVEVIDWGEVKGWGER